VGDDVGLAMAFGFKGVGKLDERIAKFEFTYVIRSRSGGKLSKTVRKIPSYKCGENGTVFGTNKHHSFTLTSEYENFRCIDNWNLPIRGKYSSDQFAYYSINVHRCSGEDCEDPKVI